MGVAIDVEGRCVYLFYMPYILMYHYSYALVHFPSIADTPTGIAACEGVNASKVRGTGAKYLLIVIRPFVVIHIDF